jgi:methylase of polypeptide subunit release factors
MAVDKPLNTHSLVNGLTCPIAQQGLARRLLRRAIHLLAYRFVFEWRRTRTARVAGFRLIVYPTVFHPSWFLTSKFFANFIGRLDFSGKHVADVGTGSGVLALAAARAGAASVLAIDVNPKAVQSVIENAPANGLGDCVEAICSDLFWSVPEHRRFDVILFSPPSFPGEPREIADRAWHAGPGYRDILPVFEQARARIAPGGSFYILLSSDSDLGLVGATIERAGFHARLVDRASILIEAFLLYELRASEFESK